VCQGIHSLSRFNSRKKEKKEKKWQSKKENLPTESHQKMRKAMIIKKIKLEKDERKIG